MRRLALLLPLLLAAPARAEHAKITLDVESPGDRQTAFVDQTPPASGKAPRPVLRVRAGEPVRFRYTLTNVYPHKTLEDVVVHFYVARIEAVGQADPPTLDGGEATVTETAFDLDMGPGRKVGSRGTLRIDRPGVYLVRVETRNTASDHEHFAAVDLVVEAP